MSDSTVFQELSNSLRRQQINAENGERRPSDRSSGHSSRVRRGVLDRESYVDAHNAFRAQFLTQLSSCVFSITASLVEESATASAPLSSLRAIRLEKLIVGKRHSGRVLHGRLCVKPFKTSGINTVLEDEVGNGVRLTIYNVLPATASLREIEACFPLGMKVIVKEPFFKICVDGKTAVRVDNPADIALDIIWEDSSAHDSIDDASVVAELEVVRREGNELFGAQNWIGAVNKYSECIDKASCKLGMQKKTSMSTTLNRVVMLAYSNRAEARLRLGAYEAALSDADEALAFDQKHVKTVVRKGKAAYGLGLFEKSCAMFKAARELSPNEDFILGNLKASTIAHEQSQTGEYDLSGFYSRMCTGDIPVCADFIGPVEIRRVHRGYGRRGLFVTEKVEPGQLLLVSNPLAILRRKGDLTKLNVSLNFQERGGYNGEVTIGIQQDFLAEIADRIMKSKRKMSQLHSLSSYGKLEVEIPSMELFRPESDWVPPGSEKMEVDMALIRDIVKLNALSYSDNIHEICYRVATGDARGKDLSAGIWALPSFANHSCAPNCVFSFIGDAMFVRAALQIGKGEELTVPYFSALFEGVETRQAFCKQWFFTCKCERCQVEETLKPQLARIKKAIAKLAKAAKAESSAACPQKRQAAKDLAKVADEVEALIQSLDIKVGPRQQGWIRAAFIAAYFAKFRLAMDEHDSQSRITTLRVIVDSMASVSVTDGVLQLAAILLREVEQRHFKHSQSYRLTLDRVLGIYRVMYGKQPNGVLHKLIRAHSASQQPNSVLLKLIRAHWAPLGLEDLYE